MNDFEKCNPLPPQGGSAVKESNQSELIRLREQVVKLEQRVKGLGHECKAAHNVIDTYIPEAKRPKLLHDKIYYVTSRFGESGIKEVCKTLLLSDWFQRSGRVYEDCYLICNECRGSSPELNGMRKSAEPFSVLAASEAVKHLPSCAIGEAKQLFEILGGDLRDGSVKEGR